MALRASFFLLLVGLSHGLSFQSFRDGDVTALRANETAGQSHRIPKQILFTGHEEKFIDAPFHTQTRIKTFMQFNPDLKMVWMGDNGCYKYIKTHCGYDMAYYFIKHHGVKTGSHRGAICRTCFLHREGGFYMDHDVQLLFRLEDYVQPRTTFMAVQGANGGMLDSLIAATPKNEVLAHTLRHIGLWGKGQSPPYGKQNHMGSVSLMRGLKSTAEKGCKQDGAVKLAECGFDGLQLSKGKTCHLADEHMWICGHHHAFQLYKEKKITCDHVNSECSSVRKHNAKKKKKGEGDYLLRAIYSPNYPMKGKFMNWKEDVLVGWPHREECPNPSCTF